MRPERPDELPVHELFRRPLYWLLMLLPIAGFTGLHVLASGLDLGLVVWLPVIATLGSYVYARHVTLWLRRRWGRKRERLTKPETET